MRVTVTTVLLILALAIISAPVFLLRTASADCIKAGGRVQHTEDGWSCVFPSPKLPPVRPVKMT
jgi:hypothetical protein